MYRVLVVLRKLEEAIAIQNSLHSRLGDLASQQRSAALQVGCRLHRRPLQRAKQATKLSDFSLLQHLCRGPFLVHADGLDLLEVLGLVQAGAAIIQLLELTTAVLEDLLVFLPFSE